MQHRLQHTFYVALIKYSLHYFSIKKYNENKMTCIDGF